MYKNLVTSDIVMNQLIIEQQHLADAEKKLELTQVKLADFINQCNGFKASIDAHETNLKQIDTQINVINRDIEEKESIVSELQGSTEVLVLKLSEFQDQVSVGKANLEKILQTQTDTFLKLDNLDDEKVELTQKQEEKKKLIHEAPAVDSAGFFDKIRRRRRSFALHGELNKLGNQIQDKQTNWQEMNAKLEDLRIRRKEQDLVIKNDVFMVESTEKTIKKNEQIIQTHSAELKRLRNEAQNLSLRYQIVTDKVTNLRELILEKQGDIENCSKDVVQLEQIVAEREAIVIEKKKTHAEVSDEVTLANRS